MINDTAVDGRQYGDGVYGMARVLSVVLHPLLMPVYAVVVLLFGDTIISGSPLRLKMFYLAVVVINSLVIPVMIISLLRLTGYISNFSLERRQDRTIPLMVVALSYGVCLFLIDDLMSAFMLRKFLFAAMSSAVVALVITFFWKVSLHMVSMGGVLAVVAVFALAGFGDVKFPLIVAVLLCGMLGSARLLLGKHSPMQVMVGFVVGFAASALAMMLA